MLHVFWEVADLTLLLQSQFRFCEALFAPNPYWCLVGNDGMIHNDYQIIVPATPIPIHSLRLAPESVPPTVACDRFVAAIQTANKK